MVTPFGNTNQLILVLDVGSRGTDPRIHGMGARRADARNGKGLVLMSKKGEVHLMFAKGGVPQSEVAAALYVMASEKSHKDLRVSSDVDFCGFQRGTAW